MTTFPKELWRRFRYLTNRSRFHSDLSDEIQFHVESRASELEEIGVTHEEALARARREFGPRMRVAEDTHGVWRFHWLEISPPICATPPGLQRNPDFALTAISCLALGISANTTIFSITTSFLFSVPFLPRFVIQ